jgi:hypothetical protein
MSQFINREQQIWTFVTLYCRYRLKRGGFLQWFDGPYCTYTDLPYGWRTIELAGIVFAERHALLLEELVNKLCNEEYSGFWQMRQIMLTQFGHLETPYAIIAGIALIGRYCQRLQAMDIWTNGSSNRDFRREIDFLTRNASHWARHRFMEIGTDFEMLQKAADAINSKGWKMVPRDKKIKISISPVGLSLIVLLYLALHYFSFI